MSLKDLRQLQKDLAVHRQGNKLLTHPVARLR
jgi:hypothetical protein